MNDLMNYFFGPLPREYCLYYYFLSVITAIVFAITLLSFVFAVFKAKKVKFGMLMSMFSTLLSLFVGYFVSRLLYTMCSRSL